MAPPDPQRWTYTDYVCFLRSHGFHNLACLDDFLRWGVEASRNPAVPRPQKATTILLEFGTSSFRTSDLTDTTKLRVLLKEWTRKTPSTPTTPQGPGASRTQGRIIMVNNLNPELADTLGGLLNIEPAFFASFLADHGIGNAGEVSTASPLASHNLRHQKNFFTIEYPCAFVAHNCGKDVDIDKLYCKDNYRRRVEVCSKHGKHKVAVARRKISFYMKSLDPWLCVVLVDPPISHFTLGAETTFGAYSPTQRLEVTGYQGGYLDFIEMHRPSSNGEHDYRACGARPMCPNPFDDLCRHWQIMARDGLFNQAADQSMIKIMRPAFQIAASECTNFFDYIRATLESQPISTSLALDPPKTRRILDKCISLDSMLSRYKPILTRIKAFVSTDADLNDDYRAILIDLHHYRAECDSQMQHILAVSQCQDTASLTSIETESARQADYSRYLTIIALIYAPFALACAVFSMPHDFVPAAHYLYGFLPATAGVTILFLLLVLPEARDPLPILKAALCGKLTRKRLLAKPKGPPSTAASEKRYLEDV